MSLIKRDVCADIEIFSIQKLPMAQGWLGHQENLSASEEMESEFTYLV